MSANYEQTQQYIDPVVLSKLKETLKISWTKPNADSTSSVAITQNNQYYAGEHHTHTHILNITSEQAAIVLATNSQDPEVTKVITLTKDFTINPLNIKILADHTRRSGTPIDYIQCDETGRVINKINSMETYYKPEIKPKNNTNWKVEKNSIIATQEDLTKQLYNAAKKGMNLHYSTKEQYTKYGAAVHANGKIYYAGVYSSYEHRLNVHAEMAAAISAINNADKEITHVAVISDKTEGMTPLCGCCRQFFTEHQQKTGKEITIIHYTIDGESQIIKLNETLPHSWHPK